jgi:hypothetical protein
MLGSKDGLGSLSAHFDYIGNQSGRSDDDSWYDKYDADRDSRRPGSGVTRSLEGTSTSRPKERWIEDRARVDSCPAFLPLRSCRSSLVKPGDLHVPGARVQQGPRGMQAQ